METNYVFMTDSDSVTCLLDLQLVYEYSYLDCKYL